MLGHKFDKVRNPAADAPEPESEPAPEPEPEPEPEPTTMCILCLPYYSF